MEILPQNTKKHTWKRFFAPRKNFHWRQTFFSVTAVSGFNQCFFPSTVLRDHRKKYSIFLMNYHILFITKNKLLQHFAIIYFDVLFNQLLSPRTPEINWENCLENSFTWKAKIGESENLTKESEISCCWWRKFDVCFQFCYGNI